MPESRKALVYWSGQRDSNSRPTAWEAGTLPLSYARPKEKSSKIHFKKHPEIIFSKIYDIAKSLQSQGWKSAYDYGVG